MKRLTMLLVTITAALLYFQSGVRGAEIEPVYLSPRPAARLVQPESAIAFRFAEDVDAGTVGVAKLRVRGSISAVHAGGLFVARDGRTVIFEPQEPFAPGEMVAVRLSGGLFSTTGNELKVEEYDVHGCINRRRSFSSRPNFTSRKILVETSALQADYLQRKRVRKLLCDFAGQLSGDYGNHARKWRG